MRDAAHEFVLRFIGESRLAAPGGDEQRRDAKGEVERGERVDRVAEAGVLAKRHGLPPGEAGAEIDADRFAFARRADVIEFAVVDHRVDQRRQKRARNAGNEREAESPEFREQRAGFDHSRSSVTKRDFAESEPWLKGPISGHLIVRSGREDAWVDFLFSKRFVFQPSCWLLPPVRAISLPESRRTAMGKWARCPGSFCLTEFDRKILSAPMRNDETRAPVPLSGWFSERFDGRGIATRTEDVTSVLFGLGKGEKKAAGPEHDPLLRSRFQQRARHLQGRGILARRDPARSRLSLDPRGLSEMPGSSEAIPVAEPFPERAGFNRQRPPRRKPPAVRCGSDKIRLRRQGTDPGNLLPLHSPTSAKNFSRRFRPRIQKKIFGS